MESNTLNNKPLADRMRPKTLKEYVGQEHLVGKNGFLENSIKSNKIPSFILWGPPGVGKTTLAQIIANTLERPFFILSAINSGVKDIREVIEKAGKSQFFNRPGPILFIDEIHRFSKSQQDSLLKAVEEGIITLIGATTENPSFEVISPLLSRCQVYTLNNLSEQALLTILNNAIEKDSELKNKQIEIKEHQALLALSGGDARKLLNILELTVNAFNNTKIVINNELVENVLQNNLVTYDKKGEYHYDIISAFIKSIRGSDPNGAVYWLARMVEGGEDVKFIARRLIILAAEDIGLANPNALLMAKTCFDAVNMIGWPESRIILSETTIYLACSPKSNSAYEAINKAQEIIRKEGHQPVPLHLRNAPTQLMKDLNYGKNYKYAHSYSGNFIQDDFLPENLKGTKIYEPGQNKQEESITKRLKKWWGGYYNYQ